MSNAVTPVNTILHGEHSLLAMCPGYRVGPLVLAGGYRALMSPMPDQAQLPCSHFLRYLQGFLDPFV